MAELPEHRLIIDTDPGVDDAIALVMALTAETIAVDCLTIVAGNVDFDRQVANAQYVLELTDRANSVPVYEGARSPLLKDYETDEGFHGDDGLGGVSPPEPNRQTADGHAADRIVEAARSAPGEYTLVCLGPLTNLALALQREPDLEELLDDVWVMGGTRRPGGTGSPAAEFNFWVDPDAAKVVTQSLDPTLVTWDVCEDAALVDTETLERVTTAATPTGYHEFLSSVTATPRGATEDTRGLDGVVVADALVVAALVDPAVVADTDSASVAVDEREGLTRGYLAVDKLGVRDWSGAAQFVTGVNSRRFRDRIVDTFAYGDPLGSIPTN